MTGREERRETSSSVHPIVKVLLIQLGLGMVVAMLFWGMNGPVSGYSALLGGLICVVPNAFLALRLSVPRRDPGARALVQAAYVGELGKLALRNVPNVANVAKGLLANEVGVKLRVPRTRFNGTVSAHRVFDGRSFSLDEIREMIERLKDRAMLIRFSGPISFGAANRLHRRISGYQNYDCVMLDLTDVPDVDSSATLALVLHHLLGARRGPFFLGGQFAIRVIVVL